MRSLGNRFTESDFHTALPSWWSDRSVYGRPLERNANNLWFVAGASGFPVGLSALVAVVGAVADVRFAIYSGTAMLLTSIILEFAIFAADPQ